MNQTTPWIFLAVAFFVLSISGCMFGMPRYNVWQQEMEGKAELAKAEQNRQIAVAVSRAELESAKLKAEAEIARAQGAAQANTILIATLGGAENYLRWRYIMMLENGEKNGVNREIIYTPSGGTFPLPITEAGRAVAMPANPTLDDIQKAIRGTKQ